MKKLSIAAGLAALAIAAPLSIGSSHREAPLTSIDPTGDDTDLYAFTAEDAPDALTIASNWIPFEDPAGGPNFYKFDDNAHYYLNIDNTGDGRPDVRYLFDFETENRNPKSFLYANGMPVETVDGEALNIVQTYSITREEPGGGSEVIAEDLPVAPSNVGPKTVPDYEAVAAGAVKDLPGGGKVFAGQREDPFFASLGRIFDTVNLEGAGLGNEGGGVDDLAGYAVHSIVLQVPEADVTVDAKPVADEKASNAVVGVWTSTERQTISPDGSASGDYQQISRLGNPLVNEVIIPVGDKDRFNRTTPDQDAANYGQYVTEPELAKVLNVLYPDVAAPEKNRTDIVQAVLQGVPDLNAFPGKAGMNATDTLKLNLGVAPAAEPDRLGVIAGDTSGYPNGRRLIDDVVDIDLQVVAGALKGNEVPLGDGVNQNDVEFLTSFPYLAAPKPGANPDAGYGSQLKALAGADGSGTLPSFSAGDGGGDEDDDDGMGALVWILVAAGALALAGIAYRAGRGSGGSAA